MGESVRILATSESLKEKLIKEASQIAFRFGEMTQKDLVTINTHKLSFDKYEKEFLRIVFLCSISAIYYKKFLSPADKIRIEILNRAIDILRML